MKETVIGMLEMGTDTEERRYFRQQYLDRLEEYGARVKMIPQHQDSGTMREAIQGCRGILFPGGVDPDPSLYGQTRRACCGQVDRHRDRAEICLYQCIRNTALPVLGICRGLQILNILEGGTSYQDIKEAGKKLQKHRDSSDPSKPLHQIRILPGSRLEAILGCRECAVNSMHHQAAALTAPSLQISACSDDGLTEALEMPDHPFFIAVQWHPEHMAKDRIQQKIFSAFIHAAEL